MYIMETEEQKKYVGRGLTGLTNLGNTCFMNSTIQCLSHTYELNDFLKKGEYKKKLNRVPDSLVLWEYDKLRDVMWSENCIISPGGFLHSIQRIARIKDAAVFTGFDQNDVAEFLQFIIDCFHNSIKREVKMTISGSIVTSQDKLAVKCYEMMKNMYKKDYSEMLELFYGIHVSVVKSLDSDYESITPEPFFNLQLELPNNNNNPTISQCIDKYTAKEILDEKYSVEREGTSVKENCSKTISFWSLPKILIITLKRFNNNNRKDQRLVNLEHDLDMTNYVKGYKDNKQQYELYGICNHSGGTRGGHYTSFVKNANNKWYLYNDTNVVEIKDLNKLNTPQAYCFFYRKK